MLNWVARFPHYQSHLQPILDGLSEYTEVVEGKGPATLVAGLPDVSRCKGPKVILLEHGAGQTYEYAGRVWDASGPSEPDEKVTLYLAPSERVAEHMEWKLPNAEIVVVGSPQLEALHQNYEGRGTRVVFAVHWPSPTPIPEAGTSWPWSAELLRALHWEHDVLAHAHPRFFWRFKRELTRTQLTDVEVEEDWRVVVNQASVLVCDNSSIIWEADSLGIPVVLMDPPHWNPDAPHGLRWGVEGEQLPRVTEPEDLINVVRALVGPINWAPTAKVYDRIQGSTLAAVDAILNHLG